jgi:hypothetical protein
MPPTINPRSAPKGEKLGAPRKYSHLAKVTVPAHQVFPIDMLRYDCCRPYTERDSAAIVQTLTKHLNPPRERIVIIEGLSDSAIPNWHEGRWESCYVKIEPISVFAASMLHDKLDADWAREGKRIAKKGESFVVIGADKDGGLICKAEMGGEPYNCGEKLEEFGRDNLTPDELGKVEADLRKHGLMQ